MTNEMPRASHWTPDPLAIHAVSSMESGATTNGLNFRLPLGDSGATWSHYRLEADGTDALSSDAGIDALVAESLLVENARPRASPSREGLLVVLRGVNLNRGADPEDMVSVRMWIREDSILTVSPRRVVAIEDVKDSLESDSGPTASGEALVAIAAALAERIAPVVDHLVDRVDDLQAKPIEDGPDEIQHEVSDVRRTAALLRRHLAPQRDALQRLHREPAKFLTEANIAALRETADRGMRFVEDLDSVRERATVLQDELSHAATTALNRNMYLLSVVAAVFLPLSLVTGLLGINVGGIPGTQSEGAFWFVVAALIVMAAIEVWILRRRKMF